jgi:hypothetical protein
MSKTFKHRGGGGDMIYGLATMYNLGGGVIHLNMDAEIQFYKALLDAQPYVQNVVYSPMNINKWEKFEVTYNLDLFRGQPFNSITILECHARAFNLKFDLTHHWLFNVKRKHIADIIINDTGKIRWEGITVKWEELRGFEDRAVFVGLDGEYNNFCENRKYDIKRYKIKDAMEFAQIIKGSKLYIGNQSTGLAIAEGLKVPRVADLYLGNSKQYPKGKNGHWELSKKLIRGYLDA